MFHLYGNVSTAAPETTERKRELMREQIATGERDQSVLGPPSPPTVGRWRSLAVLRPELMAEWHPRRNGDLDPYRIGQHAHRKVWWRCSDCGHEWQTSPNQRTSRGRGCPECGRRRSIAANVDRGRRFRASPERSIATVRPDLMQEWHPTRNGELDPYTIAAGSERKVWWRCSDCGREWRAVVGDRTRRQPGCPTCGFQRAGRRRARAEPSRSFAALYPHLLAEWHTTKNGQLDPYTIKPGSERRLWWTCSYCGSEWQAPPSSRRHSPRGGCPTCAIRLARGVEPSQLAERAREQA